MADMYELANLEEVIKAAISGDLEARASLVEHPAVQELLARVSKAASAEFNVDRDEIKEHLLVKLFNRVEELRKPENLRAWCHFVARRYCLNVNRHLIVVKRYEELVKANQSRFGRWQGAPLALAHDPSTPEEELIKKEEEEILRERALILKKRIQKATRDATRSFPESLVNAWAAGKSVKEISDETGIPMATVYRQLKGAQKRIVTEAISEIETIRDRMQASHSMIEYEKWITRMILEGLKAK